MKVYLAGPDVFLPDADRIGRLKRDICKRHGLEGLFPLDGNPPESDEPLSLRVFRANTTLMDQADAIIANLTPFRGPSADCGTVFELYTKGVPPGRANHDGPNSLAPLGAISGTSTPRRVSSRARRHRTQCPGATSSRAGVCARQDAVA